VGARPERATAMLQSREVSELKQLCQQARNTIANLFVKSVVVLDDYQQVLAWGQYLDLHQRGISRQHGIYATSAGIRVLAQHDKNIHAKILDAAAEVLPLHIASALPEGMDARYEFTRKGDLHVVYKVVALVEAIEPDKSEIEGTYPAVDHLLSMRHRGGGWSDFRLPELDHVHGPQPHATACALLALSRFRDVRSRTAWAEAVDWLVRQLNPQVWSIATVAMTYMALVRCGPDEHIAPTVARARSRCYKALVQWASRATPEDIRRTVEATEYLLPKPGRMKLPLGNAGQEFTFLMYLPHCMAALALMSSVRYVAPHNRIRRFIMDVVATVAQGVHNGGKFVAAGRSAVSSVEHMWLYTMLARFEQWDLRLPQHRVVLDWWRHLPTWPRRLVPVLALTAAIVPFAVQLMGTSVVSLMASAAAAACRQVPRPRDTTPSPSGRCRAQPRSPA
jgi:hypothetical protein